MVPPREGEQYWPHPDGGLERDVSFAEAAPGVHAGIDAAYHATYDSYGPQIVGMVVGPRL